jgi:hypothetical protein
MRRIVVTSASGANGDGYGALLCFSAGGRLAGPFSDDRRITDPRGLSLSPARVLAPEPGVKFTRPRGLRFGPGGRLYCTGRDHIVAFDYPTGKFLGVIAELRRLNGQALLLLP